MISILKFCFVFTFVYRSNLPASTDDKIRYITVLTATMCIITLCFHISFYIIWRRPHKIFRNYYCGRKCKKRKKSLKKGFEAESKMECLLPVLDVPTISRNCAKDEYISCTRTCNSDFFQKDQRDAKRSSTLP